MCTEYSQADSTVQSFLFVWGFFGRYHTDFYKTYNDVKSLTLIAIGDGTEY